MMIWSILILLHAGAAIINFITGLAVISPERTRRHSWLMPLFLASLAGLLLFMVAATVSHWTEISSLERFIFSGLAALGAYMLYRAINANKLLQKQDMEDAYIDNIGFILISLFNGFTIVALVDLGAPGWLVAAGAVAAVMIGARLIKHTKRRLAAGRKSPSLL